IVPSSFGCGSAVFAAIATLAPSRAARSAIASPMPRLPPDTNNVLPLRDVMGALQVGPYKVRDAQFVGTTEQALRLCRHQANRQSGIRDLLPRCFGAAGARIGGAEQAVGRHR